MLLLNEDITSEVFVSPRSNDTPASGATTQAVADQLAAGGHLSYVYLGRGLSQAATPDTIVAYEKLINPSDGTNVLYADGHVEWVTGDIAAKIINRASAGNFPVTQP